MYVTFQLEVSEKEKKKLASEMEGLREEITAALRDRDRAIKQVNEIKDRHLDKDGELEHVHRRDGSDRQSQSGVNKEGDAKDLANKEKETESLRREIDRLQAELSGEESFVCQEITTQNVYICLVYALVFIRQDQINYFTPI